MLNKTQLSTMLSLQNDMNTKVNPKWLGAGYGYLRAAMVESVEAIDHHGWKWWKAQHKDLGQLQMEMIDIWHFALSAYLLENSGDIEQSADKINHELIENESEVMFDGKSYSPKEATLLDNLQLMTGLCAANRFSCTVFMQTCIQCELSSEELYRQYVGKNVLNFFRQDNGYKEGSYVKVWNNAEDNEHLMQVLASLDINDREYAKAIYAGLKSRYPG